MKKIYWLILAIVIIVVLLILIQPKNESPIVVDDGRWKNVQVKVMDSDSNTGNGLLNIPSSYSNKKQNQEARFNIFYNTGVKLGQ